jgi:hypothetical protein
LALAGLAHEDADAALAQAEATDGAAASGRSQRNLRGHALALKANPLVEQQRLVRIGMKPGALATSLVRHGFDLKKAVREWFAEFRVPLPD